MPRLHLISLLLMMVILLGADFLLPGKSLASPSSVSVLGSFDQIGDSVELSNTSQQPKTDSVFAEELVTEEESIPYETERVGTDELFIGEEQVVQEGQNGTVVREYRLKSWNGEEFDRQLTSSRETPSVNEIIHFGTKMRIETLVTDTGELKYYRVERMWSTSYDGDCYGCSGRTATGTSVVYGVCAVDPNVIPMGSYVYVPGYGRCHAEDTGGAIKGNKIDLGFADVRQGWWSARYVDVYFLIN